MEPVLINIAMLFEKMTATQEGRESLMQMCSAIEMYVAGKVLPVAPTAAVAPSNEVVAVTPATASATALPRASPEAVAASVAKAGATAAAEAAEAAASAEQKKFPDDYEIIIDIIKKVVHDMDAINNITDVDKRFLEINKLYEYITFNVPGILLFNNLQKCVKMKIDVYLNQLETSYKNIIGYKFYRDRFTIMKYFLNRHNAARFSWYEGDARVTVVQTGSGSFKEIRRGELTGKKLTHPRRWADFHALNVFWSENGLTNRNIATSCS
jgi:hypothetical protein